MALYIMQGNIGFKKAAVRGQILNFNTCDDSIICDAFQRFTGKVVKP